MHDLREVRAEYNRLDALIGVDTKNIELKISSRAVRQLGIFRYPKNGSNVPLSITFSKLILNDDEQFWDTVRHEYAHAAVYLLYPGETHGHDSVWKDMCARVGCSGSRLASDKGRAALERKNRAKYMVRCDRCGMESLYVRRSKAVELLMAGKGRSLRCTGCGSRSFTLFVKK